MKQRRLPPEDHSLIYQEIGKANDRAAILVGVSLMEHGLERAIRTALREPATQAEEQALFSDRGIVGTLSQAINLAVGPETKQDMHRLRDIRNEAAHNVNQVSFETEPIRSWMRELKYLDMPIADPRSKFMLIITLMSSGLLVTAAHNSGEEYGSEDEDQAPDAGDGELPSYVSGPRPGLPSRGGDLIVQLRR
jgi:hypothetical protein